MTSTRDRLATERARLEAAIAGAEAVKVEALADNYVTQANARRDVLAAQVAELTTQRDEAREGQRQVQAQLTSAWVRVMNAEREVFRLRSQYEPETLPQDEPAGGGR